MKEGFFLITTELNQMRWLARVSRDVVKVAELELAVQLVCLSSSEWLEVALAYPLWFIFNSLLLLKLILVPQVRRSHIDAGLALRELRKTLEVLVAAVVSLWFFELDGLFKFLVNKIMNINLAIKYGSRLLWLLKEVAILCNNMDSTMALFGLALYQRCFGLSWAVPYWLLLFKLHPENSLKGVESSDVTLFRRGVDLFSVNYYPSRSRRSLLVGQEMPLKALLGAPVIFPVASLRAATQTYVINSSWASFGTPWQSCPLSWVETLVLFNYKFFQPFRLVLLLLG